MNDLNDRPFVSVVTATRNRPYYLKQFIESVLAQHYDNWELVIVDDGSDDETADLIRGYQEDCEKVVYLREEQSRGFARGLHKAMRHARGELACFMGDDDMLMPEMLGLAVEQFTKNPDLGLVYGEMWHGERPGEGLTYPPGYEDNDGHILSSAEFVRRLRVGATNRSPNSVFRKSAYDAIGGVDVNEQYKSDLDLWYRLTTRYETKHIPKPFSFKRYHASNLIVQNREVIWRAEREYWLRVYSTAGPELRKEIQHYLGASRLLHSRQMLDEGSLDSGGYRREVWETFVEEKLWNNKCGYRMLLIALMPGWVYHLLRRLRGKWRSRKIHRFAKPSTVTGRSKASPRMP